MSTSGETRAGAQTADSHAAASAWSERESRLGADIAKMQQGPVEHLAGLTDFHAGQPSVEVQQQTHGQPAPALPDVGGHGSASDPVG